MNATAIVRLMLICSALGLGLLSCASTPRPATKQPAASQPAAHAAQHHAAGHRQHHGWAGYGGRMPHRFADAEKWAKHFESAKRAAWQRPAAVLAAIKLTPAMRVADIGSATGYFAARFARLVPRGKVWGIDVEADMVRYLNQRASREGLKNLKSVQGGFDDPKIPQPMDLIFVCDTYHHIRQRTAYFGRLRSKLNPGGRLVIVDFEVKKTPVGPPLKHRVSPAQLEEELGAAGYQRLSLDTTTLPYQYIAIYRDKAASAKPAQ